MVVNGDGEKVSLTLSTWVGIVAVLASVIVVPMLALQGRITTVENQGEYNSRRIDKIETAADRTRTEILGEIKELRSDIKQIK